MRNTERRRVLWLLAQETRVRNAEHWLEMEMGGSSTREGPRGGVPLSFIPEPVWVLRRRLFVRPA